MDNQNKIWQWPVAKRTVGLSGWLGLLGLVAVGLVPGLTGCSNNQPSLPPSATLAPMWLDQFNQALADPNLSDFERAVLSDYQITDAEYQEAKDRFVSCMANLGWVVTYAADDSYSTSATPGTSHPDPLAVITDGQTCEVGTTGWIQPIYLGMRENPQGLTREQQIRACFQKNGVSDGAGLSDDEFAQMVDDVNYHASTPEGILCYQDPTGALGYTVEQAEEIDAAPRVQVSVGPDGESTVDASTPN